MSRRTMDFLVENGSPCIDPTHPVTEESPNMATNELAKLPVVAHQETVRLRGPSPQLLRCGGPRRLGPTYSKSGTLRGLERSHVDGEAVLHIGLEQPLVSFVDILHGDDFDVGGVVVLVAE